MTIDTAFIEDWIQRYLTEEAPRSKSLIITVFGDSIAPYARGLWLGALIELMAPFGVNERLLRTSAYRLVEEKWLSARREGRRSRYALTAAGVRRFDAAYSRIYTPPQQDWDGQWTVVVLPRNGDSAPDRMELRRELEWQGYATPTPGVMLHPAANHSALREALRELGIIERTIVMQASSLPNFTDEPMNDLLARCWDLVDVSARYERLVARFQPLYQHLTLGDLSPNQAFMVQTLLIHSFRRAALHDPRLPTPLLPPNWSGTSAYQLCRSIYGLTFRLAQRHLKAVAKIDGSDGADSRLSMSVQRRFGGTADHGAVKFGSATRDAGLKGSPLGT